MRFLVKFLLSYNILTKKKFEKNKVYDLRIYEKIYKTNLNTATKRKQNAKHYIFQLNIIILIDVFVEIFALNSINVVLTSFERIRKQSLYFELLISRSHCEYLSLFGEIIIAGKIKYDNEKQQSIIYTRIINVKLDHVLLNSHQLSNLLCDYCIVIHVSSL